MSKTLELHGVTCYVPQRWDSYPEAARQQVDALVASLARTGADRFTLISVTPRGDSLSRFKLSYSYSVPPRR